MSKTYAQNDTLKKVTGAYVVSASAFVVAAAIAYGTDIEIFASVLAVPLVSSAVLYTILSVLGGRLNIGQMLTVQCALWYTLPLTYIWFFEHNHIRLIVQSAIVCNLFIVAAMVALFIASSIGPTHRLGKASDEHVDVTLAVGFLFSALVLYLMNSGQWGYRTAENLTDADTETVLVSLVTSLVPPLMCLCVYSLGSLARVRRTISIRFAALACCALFFTYASLPLPRRQTAIMMVLSLLGYLSARYGHVANWRVLKRAATGILLLVPIIFVFWQIFFQIRMASYEFRAAGVATVSLSEALSASPNDSSDEFQKNLLERPFITTSVTAVYNNQDNYLYGTNILASLINSLPSAIFPWKASIIKSLGGVGERLWANAAGIPLDDYANTVVLDSLVDFGMVGPFIYIPFYVLVLVLTSRIARAYSGRNWQVFFFFSLIVFLMSVEASPATLFGFTRNTIITMSVFIMVEKVGAFCRQAFPSNKKHTRRGFRKPSVQLP